MLFLVNALLALLAASLVIGMILGIALAIIQLGACALWHKVRFVLSACVAERAIRQAGAKIIAEERRPADLMEAIAAGRRRAGIATTMPQVARRAWRRG